MWFNSLEFLAFFVVVLLGHRLCDRVPYGWRLSVRIVFLLIASYIFYAAWRPEFLVLIVGSTTVDYIAGRMMVSVQGDRRKRILVTSLVLNLGLLAVFKYSKFAYESVFYLAHHVGLNIPVWRSSWDFALPVGISFYTFQSMSYTIDVYRGRLQPEKNFLKFALFVAYFPQLVAGPIEKARHLLGELDNQRKAQVIEPQAAVYQIAYGLFKKVVIADGVAAFIDPIYTSPGQHSSGVLALAAILFSVQIYCDFSGYTDMAIGVSKLLGIRLSLNFAYPYFSKNITEFWRTWHISLSSWLKEYLYFSLGGNRSGPTRTQFNLMATMLLGGLWHGASWNFVLWGGLHGLYLVIHKRFMNWTGMTPTAKRGPLAQVWAVPLTFVIVTLTWIPFRCETFGQTRDFLGGLLTLSGGLNGSAIFDSAALSFVLSLVGLLLIFDLLEKTKNFRSETVDGRKWIPIRLGLTAFFLLASQILGAEQSQQFIYFQF